MYCVVGGLVGFVGLVVFGLGSLLFMLVLVLFIGVGCVVGLGCGFICRKLLLLFLNRFGVVRNIMVVIVILVISYIYFGVF